MPCDDGAVDRPQRLVFWTVAEAYDAHRPGYPDELFDDLVAAFCTLFVIALWRAFVA